MLDEKEISKIIEWIESYEPKPKKTKIVNSVPSGRPIFGMIVMNEVEKDLDENDEQFSEVLMKFLNKKKMDNVRCYTHAYIRQETFSRIYSGDRKPTKEQAARLALSMHLDIDDYDELLKAASYARSNNKKDPLAVVGWCIAHNEYELADVEEAVFTITGKHLYE